MLDRQKGLVVFQCDGCSDTLEPGEKDFTAAVSHLYGAGWKSAHVDGVWRHYCETCAPNYPWRYE